MTKKIELGKGMQHDSKDDRKAVNIKWHMPWDMLVKYEEALGGDDIGSGNVHKQNKWHAQLDMYRTARGIRSAAYQMDRIQEILDSNIYSANLVPRTADRGVV